MADTDTVNLRTASRYTCTQLKVFAGFIFQAEYASPHQEGLMIVQVERCFRKI